MTWMFIVSNLSKLCLSRIENRTANRKISFRQSGFDEDSWIHLEPHSTTNFAWEDPYGQKYMDAKVDDGSDTGVWKLDLERAGFHASKNAEIRLQFHVMEIGDAKVAWFTDEKTSASNSAEEIRCFPLDINWEHAFTQTKIQNDALPFEVIVELGVIGVSMIDHRPKELSYFYLERVFASYSTGSDDGTTSRQGIIFL